MKTIGIITIHDILNYGSIYQALATQHIVEGLGHRAEIIDYKYPNPAHISKTSPRRRIQNSVLNKCNSVLKDCLPGRPHSLYLKRYGDFKRQYYHLSSKSYPSPESLKQSPPDYDFYLAGSDQIWRPQFCRKDDSFFLGFVNEGRKISYASSLGISSLPDELKKSYTKLLNGFDYISVRETAGADIVESLLGKRPPVVLDPTLMLGPEDWKAYAAPMDLKEPYILCYGLNPSNKNMEAMAVEMGRKYGMKVVRANGKFYDYFNKKIHYVLDAGPAECLSLFANASFVMAQSFHATAFAINFQKPFYALLRGDADHDSRQIHILKQLGLSDRIRFIGQSPTLEQYPVDSLDFREANKFLSTLRAESIGYLSQALSHA